MNHEKNSIFTKFLFPELYASANLSHLYSVLDHFNYIWNISYFTSVFSPVSVLDATVLVGIGGWYF